MILDRLIYGRKYAAIEHAEKSEFHYLQLEKQKQELAISNKEYSNDFSTLLEAVKGQKHVFVVFNDEQVLSKKIETDSKDSKIILRTAFPNIKLGDFYHEIHSTDAFSYVSIARKEYVDSWIQKYVEAKISVIDFSLGNLAIKNLQSFVKEGTFYTSNAKILFGQNELNGIKKESAEKEQYKINDLVVANSEILPLSGIISYYTKNPVSEKHKELENSYIQKRIFTLGLKSGLGFLFLLLLINTFLFNHYQNKESNLKEELQLSSVYKKQLTELSKSVDQKNKLLQSVYSASNSKVSLYFDEIGVSIPNTVLLSKLQYHPLKGSIREDKKLLFDKNSLVISGTSKEDEAFSNWISLLEKKIWVDKITINEYGKGRKRSNTSSFEFIIQLYND